jgi:hypothetical protein
MKTTLNIDDSVMRELKREAARRGETMSSLVEAGIRLVLKKELPAKKKLPPLPSFSMGGVLVDYTDREALYRAMEEDDPKWAKLYRSDKGK